MIAKNYEEECSLPKDDEKKINRNMHLNDAYRKNNFKECLKCSRLVINMSDHLSKYHKLSKTDLDYKKLVTQCPVIPLCLTEEKEGRRIELEGDRLQDAVEANADSIQEQVDELEKIKVARGAVENLRMKRDETNCQETYNKLSEELEEALSEYKKYRYPDRREYSETLTSWKDCYLKYLTDKQTPNAIRQVRMALDFFIFFEKEHGEVTEKDIFECKNRSTDHNKLL